MPVGDASRTEDQNSLLVLLCDAIACGNFGHGRLRKGFIDGGHWELVSFVRVKVCTLAVYPGHNVVAQCQEEGEFSWVSKLLRSR